MAAPRIVSLIASATEIVSALGMEDRGSWRTSKGTPTSSPLL